MVVVDARVTEVLAVVGGDVVIGFTESATCPGDDDLGRISVGVRYDRTPVALCKRVEVCFLDWARGLIVRPAGIMNDTVPPYVDAMMRVSAS